MRELIAKLVSQADLTEEQAAKAAETVKAFLKDKLPAAIQGPVESALTGEALDGGLDTAKSMLGGLFGGDKE